MACHLEHVMEGAVVFQDAKVLPDGNVEVSGEIQVHKVGDTYVWCDTHQIRLFSGGEHMGVTLSEEWETR